MATFQWQFDAPAGVYKNHHLSAKLFEAAIAKTIFMDHVTPISGYGKKMGETVTQTRVSLISEPTDPDLNEGIRIPEDEFSLSTFAITVNEIGRAVPFTSLAEDLSKFDLENPIQRELVKQWRLVLDTKAAAAFKTAKVKYAPTGLATNNIATGGTFGAAATANLNLFHLEELRDYLFDTLHAPTAVGDDYIGIFRTLSIRGIRRDPSWEEWHKYTDPQAKFNNEMGRIESIRLIETNHNNALGKVGTSSVLGEGLVFGEDSVNMAEVLPPELRAAIPRDFGRQKAVAWYSILAFGLIWDTANAGEARVMHVGST